LVLRLAVFFDIGRPRYRSRTPASESRSRSRDDIRMAEPPAGRLVDQRA
jgi:hypothetical protein